MGYKNLSKRQQKGGKIIYITVNMKQLWDFKVADAKLFWSSADVS